MKSEGFLKATEILTALKARAVCNIISDSVVCQKWQMIHILDSCQVMHLGRSKQSKFTCKMVDSELAVTKQE